MEQRDKTRRLIYTALFAALTFAATYAVKIPTFTGGYVHPGDAVLILGACLLGPVPGALAGALGSALTDLAGGYLIYVPGTLVIKGAMGLCCGAILHLSPRRGGWAAAVGAVAAEALMVAGYFVYEALCLGFGLGAAASVPANMGQGIFGAAAGVALYLALGRFSAFKKLGENG